MWKPQFFRKIKKSTTRVTSTWWSTFNTSSSSATISSTRWPMTRCSSPKIWPSLTKIRKINLTTCLNLEMWEVAWSSSQTSFWSRCRAVRANQIFQASVLCRASVSSRSNRFIGASTSNYQITSQKVSARWNIPHWNSNQSKRDKSSKNKNPCRFLWNLGEKPGLSL